MLKFTANSRSTHCSDVCTEIARFLQAIVNQGVARNYPSFVGSVFRKFTVNFAVFVAEVKSKRT